MLTEEQQQHLIELCKTSQAVLETTTKQLKEGERRLEANTELLRQATEDINLLLAFIKSKGLQPPKIQSKLLN